MNGSHRLEAYEAAARAYPETDRTWLVKTAAVLHRLVAGHDKVQWIIETGKAYREIRHEDVS